MDAITNEKKEFYFVNRHRNGEVIGVVKMTFEKGARLKAIRFFVSKLKDQGYKKAYYSVYKRAKLQYDIHRRFLEDQEKKAREEKYKLYADRQRQRNNK